MLSSTGMILLGIASSPIVAITAVIPSSSGMPAATRAPKASNRIPRVIGMESSPAFFRSSVKTAFNSLSALARPNSSMVKSGCAACAAAVASRIG